VADVAIPDHLRHLGGEGHLRERIGPFELQLHPLNFLQPNLALAEQMYEDIRQLANLTGNEIVYDLYCGAGVIAMYLAAAAKQVQGLESDPFNVELGRANLARYGMGHVTLHCAKAEDWLSNAGGWQGQATPDIVVLDPPRVGMHKSVVEFFKQNPPARLIYVSCNPGSLARDLSLLTVPEVGYRVRSVQGYDMFPHTRHIETVVLLER
jgi:23S rRNA (uracil1939-C5)-methyltransferase